MNCDINNFITAFSIDIKSITLLFDIDKGSGINFCHQKGWPGKIASIRAALPQSGSQNFGQHTQYTMLGLGLVGF